nr:DNRLRE domain-containing protein [uncultured Draconibacterium sp.]
MNKFREKYIVRWNLIKVFFFSFALIALITQCEIQENFDYEYHNTSGELDMTAWEFIQSRDEHSLLEDAITAAGFESYYSGSTESSFILPTDDAFNSYLSDNGYSSISEVPLPILKNVLLYHIVTEKALFTDEDFSVSNNPVAFSTQNGQIMYLSRDNNYRGVINYDTNKSWTIKTSNLEPTNGAIHIVYDIVYYSAVTGDTDVPTDMFEYDSIFATQDVYVRAGTYVDDNFGTAADLVLRVDTDDGTSVNDRKIFLMFDLSEATKSGTLREAYLSLGAWYSAGKEKNINLHNVQDITWSENTITWNNMPTPDTDIISATPSIPLDGTPTLFKLDCTDYYQSKSESPGKVTILVDADDESNDGIIFISKESTDYSYAPCLIAVYSDASSTLEMGTNTGLSVTSQGVVVLTTNNLCMEGAATADIVYTLESVPTDGWLIMGSQILSAGDKFGQLDIDAGNIVYINEGNASSDSFTVSVNDKDGGSIDPFDVAITIE